MRTAIFILGMLISMGFELLATSNGYEVEYSDSMTKFMAFVFIVFVVMDVTEYINKLVRGGKP